MWNFGQPTCGSQSQLSYDSLLIPYTSPREFRKDLLNSGFFFLFSVDPDPERMFLFCFVFYSFVLFFVGESSSRDHEYSRPG